MENKMKYKNNHKKSVIARIKYKILEDVYIDRLWYNRNEYYEKLCVIEVIMSKSAIQTIIWDWEYDF
jgi:hypothetical protein